MIPIPWFNVDDGFANSKPVLRIPRRYRCTAIGLWTLAGSWSAKELTDGFIPDHAIEEFASNASIAGHLVRAGLWSKVIGGWQFEGWEKWQKTKEQVLAFRAAEAERKRNSRAKGKPGIEVTDGLGETYSDRDRVVPRSSTSAAGGLEADLDDSCGTESPGRQRVSGVDSARTEHGVPLGHHPESGQPLPTPLPKPKPSFPLVDLGGGVTSVDASHPRPQCHDHEENHEGPCRPCKLRREWDEANADFVAADELERKRAAKAAAAKALKDCDLCDSAGWVLGPDRAPIEPGVLCTAHNPDSGSKEAVR
ncbi:hypothetical protein CCUG60885_04223 [Mycobacteroides salmoniphilum]|uniref:Uncharacterized protein n=1 Tax=Mycobacteroides salmoniphilum TaxID=404941 RepID=A0A4R8SC03_9MYCO|nr:hypothetical protein CCUG60885_04223 [Mycobacteroides salmoniphilum]TEA07339.1 hypothetical protein CCUG60883_01372 [Mycobacteroides salmoniphilum]